MQSACWNLLNWNGENWLRTERAFRAAPNFFCEKPLGMPPPACHNVTLCCQRNYSKTVIFHSYSKHIARYNLSVTKSKSCNVYLQHNTIQEWSSSHSMLMLLLLTLLKSNLIQNFTSHWWFVTETAQYTSLTTFGHPVTTSSFSHLFRFNSSITPEVVMLLVI